MVITVNKLPAETIEQIRKENNIVDIIGEYVQLKKKGNNYIGLCPFHQEKSPSFSVAEDKQIFKCFGCGKGGSVISFLMEIEGMPFQEALAYLAKKSGIDLPNINQNPQTLVSKEEQNALLASEWLAKLYNHLLKHAKDGKDGLQYILDRGITEETIGTFQIGYASDIPNFTADFLQKKGFHEQQLLEAGLLTRAQDHSLLDRFRGRVIFPIRNHLGKTIAFGGRAIYDQDPKYLNSPESELFQKNKILYNFDLAKKHIRKEHAVVLYEGYMDVIASYQANVKHCVATLGTALTEYQAALLKRYVDEVIICYDADSAGMNATYKAGLLLNKVGCNVKVANLPEGMDPDEYIRQYGENRYQDEVIAASDTFMAFLMTFLKRDYNLSLESDRLEYIEQVLTQLAMIDKSIEREYYLQELHEEFGITLTTLQAEVDKKRQTKRHKQQSNASTQSNHQHNHFITYKNALKPAYQNAERILIAYMLQDEMIAQKVQEKLGADFNIEAHQIIVTYLYAFYEEHSQMNIATFIEKLPDQALQQLTSEIAMIQKESEVTDQELADYIYIIQHKKQDQENVQTLRNKQKLAEQQNDPIKAAQIAMQILELEKQAKR